MAWQGTVRRGLVARGKARLVRHGMARLGLLRRGRAL